MASLDTARRYGAVFLEASKPMTWPLYGGLAMVFLWLAMVTYYTLTLDPSMTDSELLEVAQVLNWSGYLAVIYTLVPVFAGGTEVAREAWRDVR